MKFLIFILFCNLLSSGYLQQTNNEDGYNSIQPDVGKSNWPHQTFPTVQSNLYGQVKKTIPEKPCARRSSPNYEPISQRLSPPLITSKVEALTIAPLKAQALKHEEFDLIASPNHASVSNPQHTTDSKLLKTNSVTIINPVIDSTEELVPPVFNEIQEDNPKPSEQMHSTPISDSLSSSPSGDKSADSKKHQPKPNSALPIEPDNEYGAQPENLDNSEQTMLTAPEPKLHRSPQIYNLSTDKKYLPGYTADLEPTETQTLPPSLIARLLVQPEATAWLRSNKCSHDNEPDNLVGHSRRSMSSYNNENNAKDILSTNRPSTDPRNNNEQYIDSQIENAMASVMNTEKNTLNTNSVDQPLKNLDQAKLKTHEKSVSRARPPFNEARREMIEPTKGAGTMGQSALMMMGSERICYACSTANNPSCWAPDRRTTVKYCRKGNNACITKTFGEGHSFTLIRDCGKSCDDSDAGIMPKYKSCSMCHSELCNGAYSINGQSIIFALILIGLVKYFN